MRLTDTLVPVDLNIIETKKKHLWDTCKQ